MRILVTSETFASKSEVLYEPWIHGVRSQYPKTGPCLIDSRTGQSFHHSAGPVNAHIWPKVLFLGIMSANNCSRTIVNTNTYKFVTIQNHGSSGKKEKVKSPFKFALEMRSLSNMFVTPNNNLIITLLRAVFVLWLLNGILHSSSYYEFLQEVVFLCSSLGPTVLCKWLCRAVVNEWELKTQRWFLHSSISKWLIK